MPDEREPSELEKKRLSFYGQSFPYRHNITRVSKETKRAWCNNCCQWVSAVFHQPTQGWHCRKSYNDWINKTENFYASKTK